jgi:hypothetical protein
LAATVVALAFFAVPMFFRYRRPLDWRDWLALGLTVPVTIALAVNNGRAVIEAWVGRVSPFERTPKTGDRVRDSSPAAYRSVRTMGSCGIEVALGLAFAGLSLVSLKMGHWLDLVLSLPAAVGFVWIGLGSLLQSQPGRRDLDSGRPEKVPSEVGLCVTPAKKG